MDHDYQLCLFSATIGSKVRAFARGAMELSAPGDVDLDTVRNIAHSSITAPESEWAALAGEVVGEKNAATSLVFARSVADCKRVAESLRRTFPAGVVRVLELHGDLAAEARRRVRSPARIRLRRIASDAAAVTRTFLRRIAGDAAAATRTFLRRIAGDAAAATRTFRSDESRPRRGRSAEPGARLRYCGTSEETTGGRSSSRRTWPRGAWTSPRWVSCCSSARRARRVERGRSTRRSTRTARAARRGTARPARPPRAGRAERACPVALAIGDALQEDLETTGDAGATTWRFRGDESRRGRELGIP